MAAVMVIFLGVSACSAGQVAATSDTVPAIPGVNADGGPMALRNLLVPYRAGGYPAGSDVPLVVRVFSTADQAVELREVTPGAGGAFVVVAQRIVLAPATGGGQRLPLTIAPHGCELLVPPSGPYFMAERISASMPYGFTIAVRVAFSTGDSVQADVPMAPPAYPIGPSAGADSCQSLG
jgi:hypothetical protein